MEDVALEEDDGVELGRLDLEPQLDRVLRARESAEVDFGNGLRRNRSQYSKRRGERRSGRTARSSRRNPLSRSRETT
mgnify:CR=1 FL=1